MNVSEIMTTDVVTVAPDTTLETVGRRMLERRVGSTLVVADAPVGIVTERDLILAAAGTERALASIDAEEAMSAPLETVEPDASVRAALRQMREEGIKKLPVIEGLDLVGIVTLTDVALSLPEHLSEVREIQIDRGDWTD